jgi:hypothetical protein
LFKLSSDPPSGSLAERNGQDYRSGLAVILTLIPVNFTLGEGSIISELGPLWLAELL